MADEVNNTGLPETTIPAATADPSLSDDDRRLLDKYSRTFIGTFAHTLDTKGRLVIPQVFRDHLGEKFCIAPSDDFQAITIYPMLNWARMHERLEALAARKRSVRQFLIQMDAFSFRDQECDGQGRVLLPAKLRSVILGAEKEVEITGNSDHIRVVTRAASEEQFSEFLKNLPDLLRDMDDLEG